MASTIRVVFLGTSASHPTRHRSAPAIAVQIDRDVILMDCGEGVQRQFMSSNVSFMRVRRIFITHLHGDHFLGLPGLVQTMCLCDREDPLEIYGPPGTALQIGTLLQIGHYSLTFPVMLADLTPGDVVQGDGYQVHVYEANHPVPSLMFSVVETGCGERKPRKVFYTGDTAPTDAVVSGSRGASLLIHEATVLSDLETPVNEYGHSSARQAALAAREAGVEMLILTHISSRYEDVTPILLEAREVFPSTLVAEDLMEFVVKARHHSRGT